MFKKDQLVCVTGNHQHKGRIGRVILSFVGGQFAEMTLTNFGKLGHATIPNEYLQDIKENASKVLKFNVPNPCER